jgi:hypothetical protein
VIDMNISDRFDALEKSYLDELEKIIGSVRTVDELGDVAEHVTHMAEDGLFVAVEFLRKNIETARQTVPNTPDPPAAQHQIDDASLRSTLLEATVQTLAVLGGDVIGLIADMQKAGVELKSPE